MSQLEFLQGILPEGTRYSLRLINKKTGYAFNRFYSSTADMATAIENGFDSSLDVYYVTAGFGAGTDATADNAVAKRELYIDIDCGPSKPYADKTTGAQELRRFCKELKLPMPTIADSGNGLHVHWIFNSAVPVHEWFEVASALKAHCVDKKFEVDGSCTSDIVRVLRVPGTINSKGGGQVALLNGIRYHDFYELRELIGAAPSLGFSINKAKELSKNRLGGSLTKSLATPDPNRISVFETIWIKSVNGSGCAQVRNAIENSETLSEPAWRGVLSIAQCCEDRDWAIHKISENHPNYSADDTEHKASLTKGPYTCETFQGLDYAELCNGCEHLGKITSPIQLGAAIKTAPSVPTKIESFGKTFDVPPLPAPYVRGSNGGVYMSIQLDDGTVKSELIYPYDLYVYRRMREAEMGDVVWMRHHLPNDAVRDFMLAQKEIGAVDKFRDRLNEQGVTVFATGQLVKLQAYVAKSIQELQQREKAEEMYTRFGWTRDRTFIVGNREYTKKGVVHAPVARHLEKYVTWFTPKGSLSEWKRAANMYNDPKYDMLALGLLAGFGSVLMKLSPENGAIINFYSKKSGTGKTTLLRMINSIFGDPKALMKDAQDTHLTKVHRMGLLNGIAMCLDEMTNVTPVELSNLLYGCTQGRARDRMEAGRNMERANDLTWSQMSVWSGNNNVEDRLGTIKIDPQGEMARVVEIALESIPSGDILDAQKTFNLVIDNYGHAGDVFLNYVIPNIDAVQEMWNETRDIIYSKSNWTQAERYRINALICIVTAGVILNNLGLLSYDIGRIAKKALNYVRVIGHQLTEQSTKASESITDFINQNVNNMLVIDASSRANGLQNAPYSKPKGTLIVRYEPDTKNLYIVQRNFNRWCAENYVNTRELPSMFESETGQKLAIVKKRMGAGWDADFGAVNAYCIKNAGAVLGISEDDIVAAATST